MMKKKDLSNAVIFFGLLASMTPCLAFQNGMPLTQISGERNGASFCGVRALSSAADVQGRQPILTRRNIGALLIGAFSQALFQPGNNVFAAESGLQYWEQDAINGFSNYTVGDRGIKFKDVELGLGTPPKTGDFVRFQLSAYLLDGTLASSFAGVELAQAAPLFPKGPSSNRCSPPVTYL
jgi:hypothetical protein